MKKKSCMVIIFLILSIGVCLWAIFFRTEEPKCDISTLLLDEEDMPVGWKKRWIVLPAVMMLDNGKGAQQAYQVVLDYGRLPDQYGAGHTIHQYSNSILSTFYFWLYNRESMFRGNWSELKEAERLPLNADQIIIKCIDSSDDWYVGVGKRCIAVLRYGIYITDFRATIEERGLNLAEFQEILLKIDKLFSPCK